jgi:SAM like domain present in kinase suppressor RAS 1
MKLAEERTTNSRNSIDSRWRQVPVSSSVSLGWAEGFRQECERGLGMVDDESEAVKHVKVLQSMIDLSAERLEGLRTECVTTEKLTQHEIRTLEVHNWLPFYVYLTYTVLWLVAGKAY